MSHMLRAPQKRRLSSNESDYTLVPIGTKIGLGEINICPRCKRAGLVAQTDEVQVFTHVRRAGIGRDGFPEILNEECRVPNTSL